MSFRIIVVALALSGSILTSAIAHRMDFDDNEKIQRKLKDEFSRNEDDSSNISPVINPVSWARTFELIEHLSDINEFDNLTEMDKINIMFCKILVNKARWEYPHNDPLNLDAELEAKGVELRVKDPLIVENCGSSAERSFEDLRKYIPETFLLIHDVLFPDPDAGVFKNSVRKEDHDLGRVRGEQEKLVALWLCAQGHTIEKIFSIENTFVSINELIDYIDKIEQFSFKKTYGREKEILDKMLLKAKQNLNYKLGINVDDIIQRNHILDDSMHMFMYEAGAAGVPAAVFGAGIISPMFEGIYWGEAAIALGVASVCFSAAALGIYLYRTSKIDPKPVVVIGREPLVLEGSYQVV